ncbi:MAG: glutathione S-transferase family protein [Candidatus Pacebacteria bacterium]|nr:glutathione S-transferase family protein [Candidatus Paceibacterota bacterium]
MSWIDQKITLYSRIGSGAAAVEALMVEIGLPHTVVEVEKIEGLNPKSGTTVPDWFLNINPVGGVPAMVIGEHGRDKPVPADHVLTESSAMILALGDSAKARAAGFYVPPVDDLARLSYFRWIEFLAATVYNDDLMYFYNSRWTSNPAANAEIKERAKTRLTNEIIILQNYLGDRPYLLGTQISPLDFYAAMLCSWSWIEEGKFPKIHSYCQRIFERPKSAAIWAKHND